MKYDALKVIISTNTVKWVHPCKDKANAEAAANMGVIRQGMDDCFYPVAIGGKYKPGDTWEGSGE